MLVSALTTLAEVDWRHGDVGTGWWIVMMLGMVVFWVAVIAGIVWLVRMAAGGGVAPRAASARERLDERLANGEIEVEEYQARLAALDRGSGPATTRTAPPAGG